MAENKELNDNGEQLDQTLELHGVPPFVALEEPVMPAALVTPETSERFAKAIAERAAKMQKHSKE